MKIKTFKKTGCFNFFKIHSKTFLPDLVHMTYLEVADKMLGKAEAYLEPSQASKMEHFAKIVNG